jgi:sugar/nucleoside kinase (ribokinase family)
MAALCVKYIETKDIASSLDFANSCAAETVTHRGVTTI